MQINANFVIVTMVTAAKPDQSSCHKAYAEDAMNPRVMNVNPGSHQPVMRDTVWAGAVQKFVDENGVPKGMKRVLQERGIHRRRNRWGQSGHGLTTFLKVLL